MQPFLAWIVPANVGQPPGGPPLGTWGGAGEPFPTPPIANVPGTPGYDPGKPTHPIAPPQPGYPSHPIAGPPNWPPSDAHPAHPIVLPPGGAPPDETPPSGPLPPDVEWKTVWTEDQGWIVVGVPQGVHVTPSGTGAGKLGTTVKKDK